MPRPDLLTLTEEGLYCPAGDFHVDPWRPVPRAVITHGHADHARPGSGAYLAVREGEHVLRQRLGEEASLELLAFGESTEIGGVRLSFHPAGHVLGSAQVRLEHRGEIWVVSGDYKLSAAGAPWEDPTCPPFEAVPCHLFITESTFGLPVFSWPSQGSVMEDLRQWWKENQEAGRASLLLAYSLGKAQRLLASLGEPLGPIYTHGAVENLNRAYRASGVTLPPTLPVAEAENPDFSQALVVAPPSTFGTPWTRRFGPTSSALASGWMRLRGPRRRRGVDRGFVLSDHADWHGLNEAVQATGAERIWVTHGYRAPFVRWLESRGLEAKEVRTAFEGEGDASDAGDAESGKHSESGKDGEEAPS